MNVIIFLTLLLVAVNQVLTGTQQFIVLLGIFVAVIVRTTVPALRKKMEEKAKGGVFTWDQKYTITAVITILIAVIAALQGFLNFSPPDPNIVGNLGLFIAAFQYGWALNDQMNEIKAWLEIKNG